jgi:hypothetical protein
MYEAARIDGIHPVRVFFKVTLPLVKPALMVAVIFRLLDALRIFDLEDLRSLPAQRHHRARLRRRHRHLRPGQEDDPARQDPAHERGLQPV